MKMVRIYSNPYYLACIYTTIQAIQALDSQQDLKYEVYDRVVSEPTEASWRDAIAWARQHDCSHFLAYVLWLLTRSRTILKCQSQCWRRKCYGHRQSSQSVSLGR